MCAGMLISDTVASVATSLFHIFFKNVFFFFLRRLGVELGKSVVYQEANRGKSGRKCPHSHRSPLLVLT